MFLSELLLILQTHHQPTTKGSSSYEYEHIHHHVQQPDPGAHRACRELTASDRHRLEK